jgi:putative nucleotidyltransferase with HDIG domain
MALSMEESTTPTSLQAFLRVMGEAAAKEGLGSNSEHPSVTLDLEMTCKDGSTVWVENGITYLRDPEGRLTGYLGVSRDITERREASKQLEQSLQKLGRTLDGTIQAITRMVECRDIHTADHQRRVAQLACAIAEEMGITSKQVQVVQVAGLLHDIGKLSVPQELLNKPGKLTNSEFQLIKTHSQTGCDILKSVEFPWPIADIVVQHHERMNGSGYPSGIKEDEILIEARILGVADVVEAMNSYRPYRAPLGMDKALQQISRNKGILYDPNVVDACVRLVTEKGFQFED